jgi:hypothetical protein
VGKRQKPKKDHYLPAGLIGGFGEPAASGRSRDAKVAVWLDEKKQVECRRAESVAYERGLYEIGSIPGSTALFNAVWDVYEPRLPGAAQRLTCGNATRKDLDALVAHVAFAAVRHVGFTESLAQWTLAHGRAITEAEARGERPDWLAAGLPVAQWRWRALHAPDGRLFVLPDTGYAMFKPKPTDPYYVFVPVGPRVAVLVKRCETIETRGIDCVDHREVTRGACDFLNLVSSWQAGRRALIGHPTRIGELRRIATTPSPSYAIRISPYGGKSTNWW